MTFEISFLSIAERDISDAIEWYDLQQKGLGKEFFLELEEATEFIRKSPKAFPKKYQSLRVKLIEGFPYALFYRIEDGQTVEIYACLHLSRNLSRILRDR